MAFKTENLTEIVRLLVEGRLARSALIWPVETEEQEKIAKFVSVNDSTLAKLTTRQINALRMLAGEESISDMKAFLQNKLKLASNEWHLQVEDTFVENEKTYRELATILMNRLGAYEAKPTNDENTQQDDIMKQIESDIVNLLRLAYRESFGKSPSREEMTLTEEAQAKLRLLFAQNFLRQFARAALLNYHKDAQRREAAKKR